LRENCFAVISRRGGKEAGPVHIVKPRAYLASALLLLMLAPRIAAAQEFRVQILSAPHRTDLAGCATGKRVQRSTIITVGLDAYVEGVLAGEAAILRNHAALQTMAILARTWALRYRGRYHAQGFDFCSLTHCQVFRLPRGPHGRYPP